MTGRTIFRDIIINVHLATREYPLFFVGLLMKLFFDLFTEKKL